MDLANKVGLGRDNALFRAKAPTAPVAIGSLPDLTFPAGVEITPVDLSTGFRGSNLTFSVAPLSPDLPSDLVLSTGGLLTGTPSSPAGPLSIVIRATNPQGSAESVQQITVENVAPDFTASLSGLSANATHGPSARTGIQLTAESSGYTLGVPASIAYQWETVEGGAIAGATAITFTPDADLRNGESLFCTITPDGYPAKATTAYVIRHLAPQTTGTPQEEILDEASGDAILPMATYFTGEALTYSGVGPGVVVDAFSGELTISTDEAIVGAEAVVTATNTGGSASVTVPFTVEGLDVGAGPDLGVPTLNDATDDITLVLDAEATVYWRRDATGTNPDAGDIILGGGYDSGSFIVPAGGTTVDVEFAPGQDGAQEISFVAVDPAFPDETSLVRTIAIDIDTAAPVLTGSVPAADALGVATDTNISLTFSEDVLAATGGVTLRDTTDNSVVKAYDVVADQGAGPGTLSLSGDTLVVVPPADLTLGHAYSVTVDAGALRDAAGNLVNAMSLAFSTAAAALIDTDFGTDFTTQYGDVWSSMVANVYGATMEHRSSADWSTYGSTSSGGVVAAKSAAYPQIRFSLPVEAGRTYSVDADLPLGEGTWSGDLRIKLGSTLSGNDYAQIDEPKAGQPRLVALRDQTFTATSGLLWIAVIAENGVAGTPGGDPVLSMLRVREI